MEKKNKPLARRVGNTSTSLLLNGLQERMIQIVVSG
jgi:hypothetical protein